MYRTAQLLAILAALQAAPPSSAQFYRTSQLTCDDSVASGGLGSGACINIATDDCGVTTAMSFVDQYGTDVVNPVQWNGGDSPSNLQVCRKVADMNLTGLPLGTINLADLGVSVTDIPLIGGGLTTAADAMDALATIQAELCINVNNGVVTTEVLQACISIDVRILGGTTPVYSEYIGCWGGGLACHNATSCAACTGLADAAPGWAGAAVVAPVALNGSTFVATLAPRCGWCAASNKCTLGGAAGPTCTACGSSGAPAGWASTTSQCAAAVSFSSGDGAWMTSAQVSAAKESEDDNDKEGIDGAVLVGLGTLILGFVLGSFHGQRLAQVLRVLGQRLCPACCADSAGGGARRHGQLQEETEAAVPATIHLGHKQQQQQQQQTLELRPVQYHNNGSIEYGRGTELPPQSSSQQNLGPHHIDVAMAKPTVGDVVGM